MKKFLSVILPFLFVSTDFAQVFVLAVGTETKSNRINPYLKKLSDNQFVYWSSTEYNSNYAYFISLSSDSLSCGSKCDPYRVRAVRRF